MKQEVSNQMDGGLNDQQNYAEIVSEIEATIRTLIFYQEGLPFATILEERK